MRGSPSTVVGWPLAHGPGWPLARSRHDSSRNTESTCFDICRVQRQCEEEEEEGTHPPIRVCRFCQLVYVHVLLSFLVANSCPRTRFLIVYLNQRNLIGFYACVDLIIGDQNNERVFLSREREHARTSHNLST